MSEYQYYEFQALDRPLTKDEMAELRALSTRATITPMRFVNVYHYGDFRGDPMALMERYFDAFVYVANWGTREFMLRLPRRFLDSEATARYCPAECAEAHIRGDHVILELRTEEEDGGWEESGEKWLPSLLPLRADILDGDLRTLYLGWLRCAQAGELADEASSPPVPPGLGKLSAGLRTLAEFLHIDDDLIAVAAERSAPSQEARVPANDLAGWIRALPDAEKNAWLLRLAEGDDPHLRTELLRRFRQANTPVSPAAPGSAGAGRTVVELLTAAGERAESRRREQAEREARERARRAREEAAARAAYLEGLAGREEDLWRRVEALVETKRPEDYDQAAQLVKDLHDLSARSQTAGPFEERLSRLRLRHAKKRNFLSRLVRAGLPGA